MSKRLFNKTVPKKLNGFIKQWRYVESTNITLSLPISFSGTSTYVSVATAKLRDGASSQDAHIQVLNVSANECYIRARSSGSTYSDSAYCVFIGY